MAWSPNPKGEYSISSGYQELDRMKHGGEEVLWWKNVMNKFALPNVISFPGLLQTMDASLATICVSEDFRDHQGVSIVVIVKNVLPIYFSNALFP